MKRYFFTFIFLLAAMCMSAQSLDRMQWFNEPESWSIDDGTLIMDVTPQSDYWRISHYGFTVDDTPFLYTLRGGEFEVKVRISGEYKVRFDQAGLMLRIDKEYTMMRNCWLQDNTPVMVGMMAACPDGNGFKARFDGFKITHLPDQRRLEWLAANQE